MIPLLKLLAATLLVTCPWVAQAASSYDPYLDAAELYRMQLLANAFGGGYPGDKMAMDGLGGGVMDVPYGMVGTGRGGASDRLVDFAEEEEDSGPAYWPEELVAELAAAAEGEREAAEQEQEEEEEEEGVAEPMQEVEEEDKQEKAAENEAEETEQEEEEKQQEPEVMKDATKYSGAQLRDQEHLEHSALHGYQSVSGGTVNGQSKQTKTDKALPAYCNPPNPCPVGKTSEDNCVENFENSAENNQRLLSQQECPCDTEHMFTCPEGSQTVSSKAQGSGGAGGAASQEAAAAAASQQMQLNKVLSELSNMEQQEENISTRKRVTLVAKKSPHIIHKRSKETEGYNPYLEGEELDIAAKKDANMAKNAMHKWRLP